jgi:hypothetical protein
LKSGAMRDRVLADSGHSADVWEAARAAIQDCCNSFRKYFPDLATVEDTLRKRSPNPNQNHIPEN